MSGEDGAVLARARRGDRSAFGTLVRKYHRRVFATALHITGNRGDADDVAQDTFVRAYKGLASFDGRSDLFTWLYRITVNTALNHLRARKRVNAIAKAGAEEVEADGGRPESLGTKPASPAESAELSERVRVVLDAVSGLSPTLRVTLILATVQGLPYKQIAEILEIPEGTVAWRVNEARKQLRTNLAEYDSDGNDDT